MKNAFIFFFATMFTLFSFSCSSDDSIASLEESPTLRASWPTDPPIKPGIYNIIVVGGISNARKYLSCTKDGKEAVLWYEDGGSGRERWKIYPAYIGNTQHGYIIEVCGGVSTGRKFLSVYPNGEKCDLYTYVEDIQSNRQRWDILNYELGNPNNKYFGITSRGNLTVGRRTLSTTKNGEHVVTWWSDDASGRERWKLVKIGDL